MWNDGSRIQAPCSIIVGLLVLFLPGPLFATAPGETLAGSRHAGTLFQSESLHIYRVVDDRGRQRLVLTNLDNQGHRLSPGDEAAEAPLNRRWAPAPVAGEMSEDRSAIERAAQARGSNLETEEAAPREREINVEVGEENTVRVDDGNGTTIVININPPSAPATVRETIIVPAAITPVIVTGGIAGAFRYPDKHPFLGYGTGIRSPAWMGGLGLNAGNGYGLKTGSDCRSGLDCMFPPSPNRP